MCGAETRHFNDLEGIQKLYAPTPFFSPPSVSLFLPMSCETLPAMGPDRIGLFVLQNSRELAEKHHQADSQRVSAGGEVEPGVGGHPHETFLGDGEL